MSEIKGPYRTLVADEHGVSIATRSDDSDAVTCQVGEVRVVAPDGQRLCTVAFGPFHASRPWAEAIAKEIADALNARAQAEAEREELGLLREHFDLMYSSVLQSVALVEEHAKAVREAAERVRVWREAHPDALEVKAGE